MAASGTSQDPGALSAAVAVIIPTFNRWPLVCEAIDSALEQSHLAIEVIVVDDASADGTPAHVRRQYGTRVKLLVSAVNREKSCSRNAGIMAATAPYLCMLDSDDVLLPDGIAARLRIFLQEPSFAGIAYGVAWRDDGAVPALAPDRPSGDILDAYLGDYSLLDNNCFLARTDDMRRHGLYNPELTNLEDRDLMIRLAARYPCRYCGAYTHRVRRTSGSAQSNFDKLIRQGDALTRGLESDPWMRERLGARLDKIAWMEGAELLRALYKARRYAAFIELFSTLSVKYPSQIAAHKRMRRRYWVARVMARIFPIRKP